MQAQNTDSVKFSSNSDSIVQLYKNKFRHDLNYINGREYKPYHYPTNENPYLHSSSGEGSIFIKGNEYQKKKLLYDAYKDLLIVNPNYPEFSTIYIQLNESKIDSFTIHLENQNYTFINFNDNKLTAGLKAGFYERIYYSAQSSLLIKHYMIKGIEEALPTYSHHKDRYICLKGHYYNVTSKKKLLALFPDNKKQLKKKIKSINLSYKKMTNIQLVQLLQFIDTL
jgi:hypothetical protein